MFKNYWVCEYGPGGNYMGQPPYTAGKPKDACQLKSTLSNGLQEQRRRGDNTTADHEDVPVIRAPQRQQRKLLSTGDQEVQADAPSAAELRSATALEIAIWAVAVVASVGIFSFVRRNRQHSGSEVPVKPPIAAHPDAPQQLASACGPFVVVAVTAQSTQ
jgi:hypothetical protein